MSVKATAINSKLATLVTEVGQVWQKTWRSQSLQIRRSCSHHTCLCRAASV